MQKIKVFLALPALGTRQDGQMYFLEHIKKEYADKIEFVYPQDCVQIMFHDASRNYYVEEFLKTDCDVLWFMDADIIPFMNFMQYFTEYYNEWEVAAGVCPVWMNPERKMDGPRKLIYAVYKDRGDGLVPHAIRDDMREYVDAAGTGCMLIKRHVFQSLKKPYFFFKFNEETRAHAGGEDLNFCRQLQTNNIPVFINTKALCRHFKTIDLHEVAEYAISYANDAVDAYRLNFLSQVKALRNKSGKAGTAPLVLPSEQKTDSGIIIAPR